MLTLTETMVEVADCHTSLYYLEAPQPGPLPLSTSAGYNGLYATVATPARVTYDNVAGHPGVMLDKLSPFFRKNNYWNWFFATGQVAAYPGAAWDFSLPILCSLKARIEFVPDAKFPFQVRPIPSVLLYPFGWSTRVSLRLLGPHSWEDLAEFNQHIFADKSFYIVPDPSPAPGGPSAFTLHEVFDYFAEGVRTDVFGGLKARDFSPMEAVVVTTVLAKNGGTLKPGGLSNAQERILLRIVKPQGPPPTGKVQDHIYDLDQPNVKYVVMDNYGRFTWMEDLLDSVGRNYQHLRCYHNNTFNSLVHARHLLQLLTEAARMKALPTPLSELTDKATATLTTPSNYYENASLREFLKGPAVSDAKLKMDKFKPKPGA